MKKTLEEAWRDCVEMMRDTTPEENKKISEYLTAEMRELFLFVDYDETNVEVFEKYQDIMIYLNIIKIMDI